MPPSPARAKVLHEALHAAGVGMVATLPETWLVPWLRALESDRDMRLVEVAKEHEAVGIAMGAQLAGVRVASASCATTSSTPTRPPGRWPRPPTWPRRACPPSPCC